MLSTSQTRTNQSIDSFKLGTPAGLLTVSGLALVCGYLLHLAGFGGWLTLVVAGASLLAAGALRGYQSRFAIPAVVVAIEGAILCTMALPDQLGHSEFIAAVANLAIISTSITAAALILRRPK
jgi:uncharacterized membrane protein (UPF0136 family)